MPDQKPPRPIGDELATVMALLQFQRESFVRTVSGVDDADARSTPLPSGTTLLWLTRHLAFAERVWILHRFAGDPEVPDGTIPPGDTLTAAIEGYRGTWTVVDEVVVAAPGLDAMCVDTDGESPVSLRWVLMHLLEETARHAGHADVLRELIDGETGR